MCLWTAHTQHPQTPHLKTQQLCPPAVLLDQQWGLCQLSHPASKPHRLHFNLAQKPLLPTLILRHLNYWEKFWVARCSHCHRRHSEASDSIAPQLNLTARSSPQNEGEASP